ncbi:ubiquinone biosynthesis protein COQ4 [Dermatobacter hominis]|uniref:ubiquinone biosynthesis protein COQ4 n=1 Tax=Dermatobacter hominis TaxID=2884263 RepID=UPI001D104F94|nr:ubiquinone biosynthesis protein COQ4 [Dermatobacter hominis]UDY35086.1 ubiquinone biosynthesis protein COQ4 [Dermatobacter hominis]
MTEPREEVSVGEQRSVAPDVEESGASCDEARLIARAVATAVAADGTPSESQASLLRAVHRSTRGLDVDFCALEPLGPAELAEALAATPPDVRHRIVHDMVLGELILRPIPPEVARRVGEYAAALGVDDRYVRVARRYAQGAFGLAWLDLRRSGFAEHWEDARMDQLKTTVRLEDQLAAGAEDSALAECWMGFAELEPGTLGRSVWDMYRTRGFGLPGTVGGASAYLAQHDFVHVLADYGTNLNGELEVFALIGRADPDPKGFSWLATLVGLFGTGYVADAGFFTGNLEERRLDSPEVHVRLADALRRGQALCDRLGVDLLEVDFHERSATAVEDVRAELGFDAKGEAALAAGSPGAFDPAGMSPIQRRYAASLDGGGMDA